MWIVENLLPAGSKSSIAAGRNLCFSYIIMYVHIIIAQGMHNIVTVQQILLATFIVVSWFIVYRHTSQFRGLLLQELAKNGEPMPTHTHRCLLCVLLVIQFMHSHACCLQVFFLTCGG